MDLHPYTGSTAPTQAPALRPKLLTWTSRVWRESPGRTIPMFKLETRLEPRDVDRGYRWEQGFTLEMYMHEDSQKARDAFVETGKAAKF